MLKESNPPASNKIPPQKCKIKLSQGTQGMQHKYKPLLKNNNNHLRVFPTPHSLKPSKTKIDENTCPNTNPLSHSLDHNPSQHSHPPSLHHFPRSNFPLCDITNLPSNCRNPQNYPISTTQTPFLQHSSQKLIKTQKVNCNFITRLKHQEFHKNSCAKPKNRTKHKLCR